MLARLSSDIFTQLIFDTSARNVYITEHFLVTQKKGNLFVYLILQYSCCFVVFPPKKNKQNDNSHKIDSSHFLTTCMCIFLFVGISEFWECMWIFCVILFHSFSSKWETSIARGSTALYRPEEKKSEHSQKKFC